MELPITAIYDANILYSAPLRDFFIRLALAGLVRARWTDEIHEEWMRNVVQNQPIITREKAERVRELMNLSVRDCLVTGYEGLIESLTLPDPNDRHVLAAAIHVGAEAIVTFNLKDFPAADWLLMALWQCTPMNSLRPCSILPRTRFVARSNDNARAYATRENRLKSYWKPSQTKGL